MLLKAEIIAEFAHQLIVELPPIIDDDVTRHAILIDDISLMKFTTVSFLTSRKAVTSAHLEK